jgi:hypothetical protein
VLIDELPKESSKWVLNYLKMWTDKLPLLVEFKGGVIPAAWDEVAVTCQHSIQDFFSNSGVICVAQEDIDAIKARFVEIHVTIRLY